MPSGQPFVYTGSCKDQLEDLQFSCFGNGAYIAACIIAIQALKYNPT